MFDDALIWVGEIGVNDYACTRATTVPDETNRDLTIKRVTGFLQVKFLPPKNYCTVYVLTIYSSTADYHLFLFLTTYLSLVLYNQLALVTIMNNLVFFLRGALCMTMSLKLIISSQFSYFSPLRYLAYCYR